ncbi:MAG TPA: glycosyltransferase family 39 protein [bacterium]|nr:glycosyltransferase family 39 protein [bacterium]HOL35666.1 glycosyltransferase family 39 protein [bacterium]HPP09177.1 glycosyltransferase family 39 protein [bacterium]
MDEKKYLRRAYLLMGITFIVRLLIAAFYGLSGDEAHYYQYAMHPSLSYFDHPPLVGYAILPFLKFFGHTPLAVRFPALISSTLCMWLLLKLGTDLYSPVTGFWAVVIFCLIPLFSVLGGIMTVPDTILSVFWLLSIITIWKIYTTGRDSLWYLVGIFTGLSLLTKYSGFLIYPGIFLFLVLNKDMKRAFRKKQLYLGFMISILIFSPVLIWNYDNYWASFAFQFKHGLGEKSFFKPNVFIQNIVSQMLVISPFLWFMLVISFFKITKKIFINHNGLAQIFFSFSIPVFLVFGYASFSNEILPHWPAVGYLILIVPCAALFKEIFTGMNRIKKFVAKFSLFTGCLFTMVIPVQVVFHCFPLSPDVDPTGDLYGWDIAAQVAEYLMSNNQDTFLFTHKFYLASQMAFSLPVSVVNHKLFCLSKRIDQYDFWQKDRDLRTELGGENGIFFTDEHFPDDPGKIFRFEKIDKPVKVEIFYMGKKVKTFYFYLCHSFKTSEMDSLYLNSLNFHQRSFFKNLINLDNRAFLTVNRFASRNKWLANILFTIGYLGSTEVASMIVVVILYLARRNEFLKYFWIFLSMLIFSAVIVYIIKKVLPSARPVSYFKDQMIYVIGPILKSGSFPSGHAQTIFVSSAFLSWIFHRLWPVFFSFAIIVAFSRVFAGVHFFRDIFAGAMIGLISFWTVLKINCIFFKNRKFDNKQN